jgi:transmembrane sensor
VKKEYTFFKAVDFAQDEEFIQWVREEGRNSELDKRWLDWLREHPDKVEVIEEARILVRSVLHEHQFPLTDQKRKALWSRIDTSAAESDLHAVQPEEKESRLTPQFYRVAAALVLLAVAGLYLLKARMDSFQRLTPGSSTEFANTDDHFVEYRNDGIKTHTITLDDGSKVTLEPNSVVRYPEDFTLERKVYLTGEAFFDVARDPKKPFSVHTQELVTQVLGTSFTVRAYEDERNIRVAVRTGKVSVFSQKTGNEHNDHNEDKQIEGAVLMPNQQVVYSRHELRMVKSLVDNPMMLPKAHEQTSFLFSDSPISEVFSRLEKAYGVEIVYDEETMSNCYLNASLDGLSFHDKLRLISKGINAQYEILDAHVIISGNGCR